MEKINIAELLKDCPSGMELDCTMYDDVYFDYIDELNIIHCYIQHETHKTSITFNQHGTPNSNIKSKCVIFPKGKTTWEGFVSSCQFKDGDVVFVDCGDIYKYIAIFKRITLNDTVCVYGLYCSQDDKFYTHEILCEASTAEIRLATEEEKQKLFDAIKANSYKWNAETKTLEKLIEPRFTAGDTIKNKNDKWQAERTIQSYVAGIGYFTTIHDWIHLEEQDDWELIPNKFDINTLIPFESKVLVRADNCNLWKPALFGFVNSGAFYIVGGNTYRQCIPYEANKELLGTTNDCDDFYKLERNER